MSAAFPLQPTTPSETKPPAFGTASAAFAGLTILLPIVILVLFGAKVAGRPQEPKGYSKK